MPFDASQIKLNYVVELKSVEFVIKNAFCGLRPLIFLSTSVLLRKTWDYSKNMLQILLGGLVEILCIEDYLRKSPAFVTEFYLKPTIKLII